MGATLKRTVTQTEQDVCKPKLALPMTSILKPTTPIVPASTIKALATRGPLLLNIKPRPTTSKYKSKAQLTIEIPKSSATRLPLAPPTTVPRLYDTCRLPTSALKPVVGELTPPASPVASTCDSAYGARRVPQSPPKLTFVVAELTPPASPTVSFPQCVNEIYRAPKSMYHSNTRKPSCHPIAIDACQLSWALDAARAQGSQDECEEAEDWEYLDHMDNLDYGIPPVRNARKRVTLASRALRRVGEAISRLHF